MHRQAYSGTHLSTTAWPVEPGSLRPTFEMVKATQIGISLFPWRQTLALAWAQRQHNWAAVSMWHRVGAIDLPWSLNMSSPVEPAPRYKQLPKVGEGRARAPHQGAGASGKAALCADVRVRPPAYPYPGDDLHPGSMWAP